MGTKINCYMIHDFCAKLLLSLAVYMCLLCFSTTSALSGLSEGSMSASALEVELEHILPVLEGDVDSRGTEDGGVVSRGTAEEGVVNRGTTDGGVASRGTAEEGVVSRGTAEEGVVSRGAAEGGGGTMSSGNKPSLHKSMLL